MDDASMEQRSPVPPELSLPRYAEITAHLRHFRGERAERTFARLGVAESAFRAARATWNEAIEGSMKAGRYELVLSFSAKVNETLAKLRQKDAPLLDPTGEVDIRRLGAPPTPFSGSARPEPKEPKAPPLTLEQYASLLAELRVFPERASEIRARYFVPNDDALLALRLEWQARFSADRGLLHLFNSTYERFCQWLLKGGTNQ
jgi:hypothetical protein